MHPERTRSLQTKLKTAFYKRKVLELPEFAFESLSGNNSDHKNASCSALLTSSASTPWNKAAAHPATITGPGAGEAN